MFEVLGTLDLYSLVPGPSHATFSVFLETILSAGAVFLLYRLVAYVYHIRCLIQIFEKVPGPTEFSWMAGNFVNFPKDGHERMDQFVEWTNTHSKERHYFRLWGSWLQPFLIACHPSSVKCILKTAEPKSNNFTSFYRMLKPWLGEGLLIANGQKWARNRRLLTPAFHFEILKPYIEIYNTSTDILTDKLTEFAAKGDKFEVFQQICPLTLEIILKCAFSYDIDVQRKGNSHPYANAVRELAINVADRLRSPLLMSDILYYLSSQGRQFRKNCALVHSVADDIIQKRKAALEKSGNQADRKYLDFLDILLTARDETGQGMSPLDIRSEVDTFLFEGHDTTASALSWILYSLAEHPEFQQKCQAEIDEVLEGRDSDKVEWNDLPKFEYLTMCIKEGLRLHSPVAMVGRRCVTEIDMGDQVFPKETNIMINIRALHHNEDVWGKNHMEYIPDRFSKENVVKMDSHQFVPFSAGPRNCIGQNFAMNEEKVVLAKLLYNFTFKLVPEHNVRRRLAAVMRAENGIMMTVESRR